MFSLIIEMYSANLEIYCSLEFPHSFGFGVVVIVRHFGERCALDLGATRTKADVFCAKYGLLENDTEVCLF